MRIAVFILSLLIAGCNSSFQESQIVGKWKITDFTAKSSTLSPSVIESAKEVAIQYEYNFMEEGRMSLKMDIDEIHTAYWKLDKKNKEIVFISNTNIQGKETYKLESIAETTMVWLQEIDEIGTTTTTLEKIGP